MQKKIVITLPEKMRSALEDLTRQEGVDPDQVVVRAVEEFLFFRRLRLLRDRMIAKAQARRITSEQDVFSVVS